jgi:hypothetical protein
MPYTPEESMKALKYFYRERGEDLFGKYGPYDAFNDNLNWVKESNIGIDQGPIVVMIENHRTGLIWHNVMKDADVQAGLEKLGFQYQTVGTRVSKETGSFSIYPNPAREKVFFSSPGLNRNLPLIVKLYALDGRLVKTKKLENSDYSLDCSKLQDGLYLIQLENGDRHLQSKLLIHK